MNEKKIICLLKYQVFFFLLLACHNNKAIAPIPVQVRQNIVRAGKFHRKSPHVLKQSSVFTSSITRNDRLYSSIQRRRDHMGDRHSNCVSLPRITMDGEQLLVCSQSVDSSDSLYLILPGCQCLPTSQNSHWWIQLSCGNSGQKQQKIGPESY